MPSVLQAIAESNTLTHLLDRIALSRQCLDIALANTPLALHTSMNAGPFKGTQWCLLVDNASSLVKLKQLQPVILRALQEAGLAVESIRLKCAY